MIVGALLSVYYFVIIMYNYVRVVNSFVLVCKNHVVVLVLLTSADQGANFSIKALLIKLCIYIAGLLLTWMSCYI